MTDDLSPELLRGLTQPRMSRRGLLKLGGLAALGLPLAGCGISGTKGAAVGKSGSYKGAAALRANIAAWWAKQTKHGQLNFVNWPLYLDVGKGTDHPSLDLFTKQTGIRVRYAELIQDDDSYYGKIAPLLASGQGTGYDMMVITNGIFLDDLVERDYLIPLDQTRMSNFYTYASDLVKDPSYDRGNVFTMAWQSGITGIGYNPKYVKREITSWEDLRDPAFRGKIGMFADIEDTPNSALCAIGVNPETSTPADWRKAAQWLTQQRPLVRKYYQQDYIAPLTKGDLWISLAWSGDIFQANTSNNANLKFVVPKEGAPIWTDNMCIPAHAANPIEAMTYMDWVYKPENQAIIADYVAYITPVPAVQQVFRKAAQAATSKSDKDGYLQLAGSPLVFPPKEDYSRLHRYRVLSLPEQKVWDGLFEPIYQS
jgi:spermidine/putrescine transport system substrate-binding protein